MRWSTTSKVSSDLLSMIWKGWVHDRHYSAWWVIKWPSLSLWRSSFPPHVIPACLTQGITNSSWKKNRSGFCGLADCVSRSFPVRLHLQQLAELACRESNRISERINVQDLQLLSQRWAVSVVANTRSQRHKECRIFRIAMQHTVWGEKELRLTSNKWDGNIV